MTVRFAALVLPALLIVPASSLPAHESAPKVTRTWTADNGNGTYTNPLFFDEFSDPDMIRVGDDFYLTGTTMHAMPGLPVLHSRDLVNWDFVGYAVDKLDLGPAYRLENGTNIYGRGIWAPSFRYHAGMFYIFSNVNGATTQMFSARSPAGPWTRTPMKRSFHDLSVLFDDDDKAYVIWGYQEIHLAQLDASLTDIVPGSERIIIPKGAGMGEGSHFIKSNGQYFITSAEWSGPFRMPAARSRSPFGPYDVNRAISAGEDFGETQGYRVAGNKAPITITPPDPHARGGLSLHQGGIIQTPKGEWWGWSMFEGNGVGRLTALSPVTWQDGWPYFGLPGNLGRTPRTWIKPDLPATGTSHAPYQRSDSFDGPTLRPIWQWNHVPVDGAWSLHERPGALRLHALPASAFLQARDTLTQRAIGPQSTPVVELDASGLRPGDVAGLALLNRPYAWLGIRQAADGPTLTVMTEQGSIGPAITLRTSHVWLRAECNFTSNHARFGYSLDGRRFAAIGPTIALPYQLLTFQGVRYSLFALHDGPASGGHADMLSFKLTEGHPESRPVIPYGRRISLVPVGDDRPSAGLTTPVTVVDRSMGRVALVRVNRALTVAADGGTAWQPVQTGRAQSFQWMESLSGGAVLMSLVTNRYLHIANDGSTRADSTGPTADNADRSRFTFR